MSEEEQKFKQAVEKFKVYYDVEFKRGYNFALQKILDEEIKASQTYSYSNLDHRYSAQINRDFGIKESSLFLRGFVKACKDIITATERDREA